MNEKLIEEAAKAMAEADGQIVHLMDWETIRYMYGSQARVALAVFEKAALRAAGEVRS